MGDGDARGWLDFVSIYAAALELEGASLGLAETGDLEAMLRPEAAACAASGQPLSYWRERADLRARRVLRLLQKTYGATPDRLLAAVQEMQLYLSKQFGAIAEALLAEEQRVARLWQERSRAAFEDSPLTMWVYDTATLHILDANHAACAQYGYSVEEFRRLIVPDLWPAEDRERVLGYVHRPPARSVVLGRQRRKDGSIFWIESFGSDYPDPNRKTRLAVLKDITQERIAEEARRHAEARFERLSESGVVGILIVNLDDSTVIDINQALCEMLGYTRDEFVSGAVNWTTLTPSEWSSVDQVAIAQLRTQGFAGLREKECLRKDGTRCPILIATALVGGSETISCVLDLTERKRMQAVNDQLRLEREVEQRLRAAERVAAAALEAKSAQLQVANAELESFSSSVAHDLRAPLQAVLGFAQILAESPGLDAEGREVVGEIEGSARSMASLVDALLGLSRLTRSSMRRERVDLTALARSIAQRLARSEPDRGVALTVEDGLVAEADPDLAQAMLENLLGNAWKFTRKTPSPRIEVGRGEDDGGQLSFFVRDNGAGFDMANAEKLFEPFQRLHAFGDFPGTGIGLATVSRIVRRHGGRVWAEGKVGEGAVLHFSLPLPA
jgi:PAS domain S-box-containing protein